MQGTLEVLAHEVLIHAGFHVAGGRRACVLAGGGIRSSGLELRPDLPGVGHAIVHLPVDRARDLLRQVRETHDQAGETYAVGAGRARLHPDHASGRVERLLQGPGHYGLTRDEAGDAQMLPEQTGFTVWSVRSSGRVVVYPPVGPVAVAFCRRLGSPARVGV